MICYGIMLVRNLISDNVTKQAKRGERSKPIKSKRTYHKKQYPVGYQQFSIEEDNYLIDFLNCNPDFFTCSNRKERLQVAMSDLNRTYDSVLKRVGKLQKGETAKKQKQSFTLAEDKLIIDTALVKLTRKSLCTLQTLYVHYLV